MNAADPRAIRKVRQKEERARRDALKDLHEVLSTKAGRRVVWRTLSEAGVFRLSYVPGEPDRTEFNEGRRSIGLSLMADIHELDPELYVTMAREANEKPTEPEEEKHDE